MDANDVVRRRRRSCGPRAMLAESEDAFMTIAHQLPLSGPLKALSSPAPASVCGQGAEHCPVALMDPPRSVSRRPSRCSPWVGGS